MEHLRAGLFERSRSQGGRAWFGGFEFAGAVRSMDWSGDATIAAKHGGWPSIAREWLSAARAASPDPKPST